MTHKGNQPRLHHYLPRFYLRAFSDPLILRMEGKSAIWVYEKGKPIRRSSPEREACERDLYTFEDRGSRNIQVEEWFAELESNVSPIMHRFQAKDYLLSSEQRDLLALFAGTMCLRTPAGRKWSVERAIPAATRYMREVAAHPDFFTLMWNEMSNRRNPNVNVEDLRKAVLDGTLEAEAKHRGRNLVSMVTVGHEIAKVLIELDWQIFHSDGPQFFITSDSPVISKVLNKADGKVCFWKGAAERGVSIWFPISRTTCLRMKKGVTSGVRRITKKAIREINMTLMMCANKRVYASEHLPALKSLFERIGCKHSLERSETTWGLIRF